MAMTRGMLTYLNLKLGYDPYNYGYLSLLLVELHQVRHVPQLYPFSACYFAAIKCIKWVPYRAIWPIPADVGEHPNIPHEFSSWFSVIFVIFGMMNR